MSDKGPQRPRAPRWPSSSAHQRQKVEERKPAPEPVSQLGSETCGWPQSKPREKLSKKVKKQMEQLGMTDPAQPESSESNRESGR